MNKFRILSVLAVFGMLVAISSCVRKSFDAPADTSHYDPQIPVTHTIAQLKAMNGAYVSTTSYAVTTLTQDVVVSGIVVADDRSGNFYKQIIIQDSTGGIAVLIDAYSLYTDYPVGRKVYLKCKDMTLGYDGGTPQIGLGIDAQKQVKALISTDIDKHIIRANIGNLVKDTVITLTQAKNADPALVNRLVTITDVEFLDTTKQYTDSSATTNRYLVNCAANNPGSALQLVTRNSNYSNFHTLFVPKGHGSVTGVMTVYQTSTRTAQIVLRDTGDVKLYGPRCGSGPVGPSTAPLITIDSVRKSYPGSGNYTMPSSKISGVVISDADSKNVSTGNFIFQDNSGRGIILYLAGSTAYKLGDSLEVELTGAVLKLYNGSMEMDGLTAAKINKIASGKTVTPVTVTIADLNANMAKYESTLLKVVSATASPAGTFSGNKTLTDATGSIILRTATGATFATSSMPTTAKTFIGYPLFFNADKQFNIRNLNDIQ